MKYRHVGKSGLVVSEIALGSWLTFGNQVDTVSGKELVKKAFELGINYFDTADVYEAGKAEEILGTVLPHFNRSHIVVATKAFWPMSDYPTDKGLSRKHIIDSIEGSLERLKLSYVDIFYCHRYDPETPIIETLHAVEDIIRMGKALYWGTSEWEADQISEAYAICRERGWHPPIINQPSYSLLNRKIEKRILPTTMRLGMGTANFSPLSQGILTGKYSGGKIPEGSRGSNEKLNLWIKEKLEDRELLDRVDMLNPIADKYGITMAQLALAWILKNPGISSVITGASRVHQLEENAAASEVELREEDYDYISELFA